jgi:hypothetical protein
MAVPVSTASSVLTPALLVSTDDKGMFIHYCFLLLTILTGCSVTMSPATEGARDILRTLPCKDILDAEVRILCSKCSYIFVCILLIFSFLFFSFFFLAQIMQMTGKLRAAQGAAAEDAQVE